MQRPDAPAAADRRSDDVLKSYRYLRLAMVILVGLLAISVVRQIVDTRPGCYLGSFSAYYYTSAHAAFIASLCTIGACLIIYKGNTDTEDIVLNFSGFMAFVVALVPTVRDNTCPSITDLVDDRGLPDGVRTTVGALLITGLLAVIVARLINPNALKTSAFTKPARLALAATAVGIVAIAAFFLFAPTTFRAHGHTAAAVALFAGIIAVVWVNAHGYAATTQARGDDTARPVANRYATIAYVMIATVVIGGGALLTRHFPHALFWLEAALIGEFAVFWGIQTHELWNVISRQELEPSAADR